MARKTHSGRDESNYQPVQIVEIVLRLIAQK
jgi:hypothetical protein